MDNNNAPKVSVIIPVYQAEDYLAECMNSVLKQTMEDFELICINDGSTDGSTDILRRYAEKDTRIAVVDQENKGVSTARNKGLQAARGEYICFIDSDDMIMENALEVLCAKADEMEAEIIYFSADVKLETELPESMRGYTLKREHSYPDCMKGIDMMFLMDERKEYRAPVWQQFFKSSFLNENRILFCEDMRCSEDNVFSYMCNMKAQKTVCIPECLYIRRIRPGSLMTMEQTFEHAWSNFLAGIRINQTAEKYMERLKETPYGFKQQQSLINRAKRIYMQLGEGEKKKLLQKPSEMQAMFRLIVDNPAFDPNVGQYKGDVRQLKSDAKTKLEEYKKEVLTLKKVNEEKITLLKDEYAADMAEQKQVIRQMEADAETRQEAYEKEILTLKKESEEKITLLKDEYAADMAEQKQVIKQMKADAEIRQETHKKEILTLKKENEDKLALLEKTHKDRLLSTENQYKKTEAELHEAIENIYRSRSYRIGRIFTYLPGKMLAILRRIKNR